MNQAKQQIEINPAEFAGIETQLRQLHEKLKAASASDRWFSIACGVYGGHVTWSGWIGDANMSASTLPEVIENFRNFSPDTAKQKRIAALRAELAALEAEGRQP